MAMTEKQGGSDVRANRTSAVPAGDGSWVLIGHKWFCSAPMSDGFLVLAQALAVALQASLLIRSAPAEVADAFVGSRTGSVRGFLYGAIPARAAAAIVARHAGG
jgi:putative acyl-CoA dehydrogenase